MATRARNARDADARRDTDPTPPAYTSHDAHSTDNDSDGDNFRTVTRVPRPIPPGGPSQPRARRHDPSHSSSDMADDVVFQTVSQTVSYTRTVRANQAGTGAAAAAVGGGTAGAHAQAFGQRANEFGLAAGAPGEAWPQRGLVTDGRELEVVDADTGDIVAGTPGSVDADPYVVVDSPGIRDADADPGGATTINPIATNTGAGTTTTLVSDTNTMPGPDTVATPGPAARAIPTSTSTPSPLATGGSLILLQALSRGFTFILNQALVRYAPPSTYGTASIQFDLVSSSILFLSREGVLNAVLRSSMPALSPISAWPLRIGAVVAPLAVLIYLLLASATTTAQPFFHVSLAFYVVGALLELLIVPLYIHATRSDLSVRVAAEGGQVVAKTVVSFGLVAAFSHFGSADGRGALLGMSVGYFCGSVCLAYRYLKAYGGFTTIYQLVFPAREGKETMEARRTRRLAIAGTRQSFIKNFLTEADRLAVGFISPLGDQGGYAIAMNYASLVARILFQPIEETLRLHWSRSLAGPATIPLLETALRFSVYLVILLPTFLPPLLPPLLPIILPRKYTAETNAAATLQTYLTWYIPLLSVNGILEAFHASSATPAQVAEQAWAMGSGSAAFGIALWRLTQLDGITREQALVFASCASMLVRIAYAAVHAARFVRVHGAPAPAAASVRRVLPPRSVLAIIGALGGITWRAAAHLDGGPAGGSLKNTFALVGTGGVCGLAVLAAIFVAERGPVARVGALLAPRS